ncbi:MAG TPA: PLDc N-terminal domain-containing protein [bacterium]|nr:PLDc N-terminal domain-containing protein [bacterium]
METKTIIHLITVAFLLSFAVFWIYHIVECFRRKDFRVSDKIFWFVMLLIPVLGLILYRGIGNEFYKKNPRDIS